MVSPALGLRCKSFSPVMNGIPSVLVRLCCLSVRHMPELAVLTRFGPNKCRNEELGLRCGQSSRGWRGCGGNLRLCKHRLHFWVMFWYSLSRCVRGFKMSHARSVSCTQRRHFSPFSLNVQLWRASLIVQRVRERAWSAEGQRGRMCSTSAPRSRCRQSQLLWLQLIGA